MFLTKLPVVSPYPTPTTILTLAPLDASRNLQMRTSQARSTPFSPTFFCNTFLAGQGGMQSAAAAQFAGAFLQLVTVTFRAIHICTPPQPKRLKSW
jgi:hypothetical protein